MELKIILLREIHRRAHRAKAEPAKGEQQQRLVQAAKSAGIIVLHFRIHVRKQGKHTQRKKQWRGKRTYKPKTLPDTDHKITGHNRPHDKRCGLVEIRDRALVQRKAAQRHCEGVEYQPDAEQAVHRPVVAPKPLSPKENRVHHADAVNGDGDAEVGFVGPVQKERGGWQRNA